ncbi:transposase [Streptomyces sp. NBC_00006]|uniref:transposase n=1 Tax=Streptomyces sp. NBC_00006 TaxID=2975619 RepID=UPI00338E3103
MPVAGLTGFAATPGPMASGGYRLHASTRSCAPGVRTVGCAYEPAMAQIRAPGRSAGRGRKLTRRCAPSWSGWRAPHPCPVCYRRLPVLWGGKRGADTGPSPVDRRKTGSKHHLICDGRGTPLKVISTAATVNDITQTLALVDGIPPVAGRPGRPRRRPDALLGDKGYDSNPNRAALRKRKILPVISRKGCLQSHLPAPTQEDPTMTVLRARTRPVGSTGRWPWRAPESAAHPDRAGSPPPAGFSRRAGGRRSCRGHRSWFPGRRSRWTPRWQRTPIRH